MHHALLSSSDKTVWSSAILSVENRDVEQPALSAAEAVSYLQRQAQGYCPPILMLFEICCTMTSQHDMPSSPL